MAGGPSAWFSTATKKSEAGLLAEKFLRPVDPSVRAARRLLHKHGLGSYFVHGTGHGLGIEIHEGPRVGRGQKRRIRVGNVVTLEPGIYVEGVGGIRIEDEVAVHAGGTEVLTTAPRGLLEL